MSDAMHPRPAWRMVRPTVLWLVGFPVVMLAALAWLSDQEPEAMLRSVRSAWAGVRPGWADVLGPMLALGFSHVLRAARLRAEWQGRQDVHLGVALQVTLTHTAAVNLLPLRSGELAYPWLMRERFGLPLAQTASSLVWMRLQDACVLGWLGALGWAAAQAATGGASATAAAAIGLLATAVLVLVARALPAIATAWLGREAGRAVGPQAAGSAGAAGPAGWAGSVRRALQAVADAARRQHGLTWAWCLANWMVKLAAVAALLSAFSGHAWPAHWGAWFGAWSGEVAAALPAQPPAGFGPYEAGVALAAARAPGASEAGLGAPFWPLWLVAAWLTHGAVLLVSLLGAGGAWAVRQVAQTGRWQEGV